MIQAAKSLVDQAKRDLYDLQTGKRTLIKTGKPIIDNAVSGLLPSDVVLIGGLSSMGKTFYLEELKANIMNKELNPNSDNYVMLNYNMEMKFFNLMVRGLHESTKIKKSDILTKEFNEKDLEKIKTFLNNYSDPRIFIEEESLTAEAFYEQTRNFLITHKDKDAVIITADHLSLFNGSQKHEVIGKVADYINKLKMEFKNSYFLILSQLNRELLKRGSEEKSNLAVPRISDFELSSTVANLCSYGIIIHQPYRLSVTEFGKFNPDFYSYLFPHFVEAGQNKVSFKTENRIFSFLVKSREDGIGFKNIYIDKVGCNIEKEPKSNKQIINEIESPSFESLLKPNTDFEDEEEGPF